MNDSTGISASAQAIGEPVGIVGASGAIGESTARAMAAAGVRYETIARNSGTRRWNPDDPASVAGAFAGLDTLVYCVGVDYRHFELHPKIMKATIDGAVAAGVKRILLVGTVYPYGRPRWNPVTEDHPREPQTYKGRMRKEQEDLLFQADTEGRLRASAIRLPDFYGPVPEKSVVAGVFKAAKNGGAAQLIGPIDTPHQFVYTEDVGPLVVQMLAEPRSWGKWWHFAGSGTITEREFAQKVFAQAGRPMKLQVVNKTMLRLVGLLNPFVRELVEMNYLLTDPVIMDDSALRSLIPSIHATSYDDGIRQTLAAAVNW